MKISEKIKSLLQRRPPTEQELAALAEEAEIKRAQVQQEVGIKRVRSTTFRRSESPNRRRITAACQARPAAARG